MGDTVKKYHTDLEHKIYPGDIRVHDVSKYYAEDGTDLRDFKNADRAAGNFNEPMIYESPDGGKTIKSRPANNPPKKDKYVQQVKKNFNIDLRESQVTALEIFVKTSTRRLFAVLQTAFGKSFLLSVVADYLINLNSDSKIIISVPNLVLKKVMEDNC